MSRFTDLLDIVKIQLKGQYSRLIVDFKEITLECSPNQYHQLMLSLRDNEELYFEQLIDLCGIDYSTYKNEGRTDCRYAVVSHLLSVRNNQRIRVKALLTEEDFPVIDTVVDIYSTAEWFEREAFDMYGIAFAGHPDLRRILTDYGFVGYPLRKDFPVSGYVEMIYDEEQKRVVYQPVSIEPREVTPRIIREENYGV